MPSEQRLRSEFVIKDLAVRLPSSHGGGSGGTFLPADDGVELPWWISPIAAVLVKGHILESVGRVITEAVTRGDDLTEIAAGFAEGDPDGNPAIQRAIHEIGSAVVAGAAFTTIGGAIGYPNPDCGGTSLETIPPTITPIVHTGIEIHRVSELPRMRKQLAVALETLDRAAAALEPRGEEVKLVAKQLDAARKSLQR